MRYLHGSFVSEPEGTPDVTGVTFVLTPTTLVTVRYDPGDAFELFGQKLCKSGAQTLHPDAVAVGLVNTIVNRSARALNKVGVELDSIASTVFRAKGDQSARSKIYSATLDALGREDEKISNLRESLVSIERLLLFLLSEGRSADAPKPVREATKAALRDMQSLEQDASFKAQKVQFLLDATLGLINLAQNDIIKLFSVLAVIFMPPTVIASIYGMNFKDDAGARMALGLSVRDSPHDRGRHRALSVLSLEEVAVRARESSARMTRERHPPRARLRSRGQDGEDRLGRCRAWSRLGVRVRRKRTRASVERQAVD